MAARKKAATVKTPKGMPPALAAYWKKKATGAAKPAAAGKKAATKKAARKNSNGNWIQGAIKRPGALSGKAKAAGMSTSAYASKVTRKGSKASTATKRQANLAKTLANLRGGKKRK